MRCSLLIRNVAIAATLCCCRGAGNETTSRYLRHATLSSGKDEPQGPPPTKRRTSETSYATHNGMACRTAEGGSGKKGSDYDKYTMSREDCRKMCTQDDLCFQYEHYIPTNNCEIWYISYDTYEATNDGLSCDVKIKVPSSNGNVGNPGQACLWVAYVRTCVDYNQPVGKTIYQSKLAVERGLGGFYASLSEHYEQGWSLMKAAADETSGVYFAYYQKIPSVGRLWETVDTRADFDALLAKAYSEGYHATAMLHIGGKYFAFFILRGSHNSAYRRSQSLSEFQEYMTSLGEQGYFMTAALYDEDDGYWYGWFKEIESTSRSSSGYRWSTRPSIADLGEDFNDKQNGDEGAFFATALARGDGVWLAWYEYDPGSSNNDYKAVAAGDPITSSDWINKEFTGNGKCLSALTHGCQPL